MTVRITLVRHGRPDGTWGTDPDPGLDATGLEQARAVAAVLADLAPQRVVASPQRRTWETAVPLARRWGTEPVVEPGVREMNAPRDLKTDHATWLRTVMDGVGADHPDVVVPFRARVLRAVCGFSADTVAFTHFLAINAVVGAATDDDRVVCFAPAHCSRTTVDWDGERLHVVELGVTGDETPRI